MTASNRGGALSVARAKELAAKTCKWLSTKQGKEALRRGAARGTPLADRIREARKINLESLRTPMGV